MTTETTISRTKVKMVRINISGIIDCNKVLHIINSFYQIGKPCFLQHTLCTLIKVREWNYNRIFTFRYNTPINGTISKYKICFFFFLTVFLPICCLFSFTNLYKFIILAKMFCIFYETFWFKSKIIIIIRTYQFNYKIK